MFDFGQLPEFYPPGDQPMQKAAPGPIGWLCPRCMASNAPHVMTCGVCTGGSVSYGNSTNPCR